MGQTTPANLKWAAATVGVVLLAVMQAVAAVSVPLTVRETQKVALPSAPVTTGVPFAKGAVKDVAALRATLGGKSLPAAFSTLMTWGDGSVRWALMDTQVTLPAGGKADLVVSDAGGKAAAPESSVKVDDKADAVTVSTGPLQFTLAKKAPGLFSSVRVDGRELVTAQGRGMVVVKDEAGAEVQAGTPASVSIDQAGAMRVTLTAKGRFPGLHNGLLGYTARVTAYAGQRHLKLEVALENHGAAGYHRNEKDKTNSPKAEFFAFKGMRVELGLGLGDAVLARCEDVETRGALRVLQLCKQNRAGEKGRRPPFYTFDDFEYTVKGDDEVLKTGDRTDGVVALKGSAGAVTAAIQGFWQNYEKAIAYDAGKLQLWLWPIEGIWPRPHPDLRAGYDGTLKSMPVDNHYVLSGSVQKEHTILLDFSGGDAQTTAALAATPPMALASAEYYAATEAAPGLFAPPQVRVGDKDSRSKQGSWQRMAESAADPASPNSIWKSRETSWYASVDYVGSSSFTYGWMDFGDITIPGHGPVSLAYDWTWIMLMNALRTGDPAFVQLGGEMARHRLDIDTVWSERDLSETPGLERTGGGLTSSHSGRLTRVPGPMPNIRGVALYYMLTGSPKALDAIKLAGVGTKAAWEWIVEKLPYMGPQTDMFVVASTMENYAVMHALTHDEDYLVRAKALFDSYVVPVWKSQGPFLHSGQGQIVSQSYIKQDMKYCYAIAAFCAYHYATGDEDVFRLLQEGAEKNFPDSFYEAPLYLSDLQAYVGLKLGDKDLVMKAADSFATAFPESKCPPVFLPDNSVWHRTSAMMLRTGHLLHYAAWKMGMAQ